LRAGRCRRQAPLADIVDEDFAAAVTTHLSWRQRLEILVTLQKLDCESRAGARSITGDEADRRIAEFKGITAVLEQLAANENQAVHARWVRGGQGSPMVYVVTARRGLRLSPAYPPIRGARFSLAATCGNVWGLGALVWPASRSSRAIKRERRLARPAGLEPATLGLEVRSSRLSPDPASILGRKEFNEFSVLPTCAVPWWPLVDRARHPAPHP
jgi:hypothetical protein